MVKKKSPVTVIVNKTAGGMAKDEARQELVRLIKNAWASASIVFADTGTDAVKAAEKAAEKGGALVIAGGGDGTVSAVASVLAGTKAVLGVLPLGTLNHFAKDLGMPTGLRDAVSALAAGRETRVDAGEVNGRVFINNSGLGLYPAIVRMREKQQEQGVPKRRAALAAAARALARYRLLTVHVAVNGRELIRKTPIVFVGNNQYTMEGLDMGTRERLDSGRLSLVIPHYTGRLRLFCFSLRALLGRARTDTGIDLIATEEFRIRAGHRIVQVTLDGEVAAMTAPLHYRIRPGALRVMAPRPGR